jgi:hypothetical protein
MREPGLQLFISSRLRVLAEQLAEDIDALRADDPLRVVQVVVARPLLAQFSSGTRRIQRCLYCD